MSTSSVSKTIGCIGCGNMGGAILGGLASQKTFRLLGYNRSPHRLPPLQAKGIEVKNTIPELVREADIIILGVKPVGVPAVLEEAVAELCPEKIVLSIAASVSLAQLQEAARHICPVVRVMPNTPALVNAGMFALCLEDLLLTPEKKQEIIDLFSILGTTIVLPEEKFSAFSALVGCGPAYVFHFMDALAEAGVTLGFPRQQSIKLVTELVLGSAKLAALTGEHPVLLREQVCSPAGVTLAAVNHMDRTALRGHMIDAVLAAYAKDKTH